MELNYIKPYVALFLMVLKDGALCEAVISVNKFFEGTGYWYSGDIAGRGRKQMGILFVAEFSPDMQYD